MACRCSAFCFVPELAHDFTGVTMNISSWSSIGIFSTQRVLSIKLDLHFHRPAKFDEMRRLRRDRRRIIDRHKALRWGFEKHQPYLAFEYA
jgi:hypothetical protein